MQPLASSLQPLASIRPVNRIVTEEATERLSDYCYELPPELIANRPSLHREGARMLVLHRKSGQIEHRLFKDLPDYLTPHDLLVLNDSKVIPARLYDSSGRIEVLLIQQRDDTHWVAMVKPGRKMRVGSVIFLGDAEVTVLEIFSDGTRLLEF
ncbi:MAG TPA: S-adenosylmethionine:tRNA ribosyltransferase-isomerase, partial [Chthoniobacterales bacterium]|nr:S-adenosylmethionine:tRNA ribosyltransferase-isomerase [Chthoniobacterales bacterium]